MTDLTIRAISDVIRPFMQEVTETVAVAREVAAVVEAHLRPVVTTVEELDVLPVETIIRTPHTTYERFSDGLWRKYPASQAVKSEVLGEPWWGGLPATVIYQPAQEKP